jgi:hypothetical protein
VSGAKVQSSIAPFQPQRGGYEGRHLDGQREGTRAGILLPAILRRERAMPGKVGGGPGDHVIDAAHAVDRILFLQLGGQKNWRAHFVQLDAGPELGSIRTHVLGPVTILPLGGSEV